MQYAILNQELHLATFDAELAAVETWEALLSAGACKEGDYKFASGSEATLKIDASVLETHPKQRAVILGHMALHPCVQGSDVLLYVPDGMRYFTNELGEQIDVEVAQAERVPHASRYDFRFSTEADRGLALAAKRPVILEDVVSTLGSVAGVARLLDTKSQDVQSLAMLRRGVVNPECQRGITDYYLLERHIPLDAEAFFAQLSPAERSLHDASGADV